MENSKHTEGEWELQGTAVFGNGKLVANCVSDGIRFTDEDKANSKLIAASKDLFEALIDARHLIEKLTEGKSLLLGKPCKNKIDKAIKKATE